MESTIPRRLLEIEYSDAAQRYLRDLPPEHFMEAYPQGNQRKITLESLDLLHARRPDVQLFNELLVQYPLEGKRDFGQVVPDNMVVIHAEPLDVELSYDVELQPARPFWVLEYVSRNSKRKDYRDSFQKYETDLKVPYFLLFYPKPQDLMLFKHMGKRYLSVPMNEHGRQPIPELELEVALHKEWVRFWFRGELLPLPGDLLREVDEVKGLLAFVRSRADQEKSRADQETTRADQERTRAEQEKTRADQEKRRAAELEKGMAAEHAARETLERELEQLRAAVRERGNIPPS